MAPWQFGIVFTGTKTADSRADTVERFLRAYRKGARDYHDAVTAADGTRKDGPAADEMIKIIAKYTQQSPAEAKLGIPYIDADAGSTSPTCCIRCASTNRSASSSRRSTPTR